MHVFISFRYLLRRGIAGSYGNYTFIILRNCQTAAALLGINIALHEDFNLSPFSPTLVSVFLFIAVLLGIKWYHIVASICITLNVNAIKHLFTWSLNHWYVFGETSVQILCLIFNWIISLFKNF